MNEKYYTVEQVAQLLNMHAKTIQRYIREGKLRAGKIGKSWVITGHDLSLFAEGHQSSAARQEDTLPFGRVRVSSVVDIDLPDSEDAVRILNTLTAAMNAKPEEYGASSMSGQVIEPERKLRLMLWGGLEFTRFILDSVSVLVTQSE